MTDGADDVGADEALVGTGAHMTPVELRAWTRFLDAGRLIEEVMADHLTSDHAMSHADYEVLVRLDGAGGRMRLSELAEQVVWSPSRLTHTLSRLEQRGWVDRRPLETDRRGVVAVLLRPGRAALAAAAPGHADLIRQHLLDRLDEAEIVVIGDVMDRLSQHMRTHRRGDPCELCDG